jgi:isoleucyl-tRNA synthetase
MYQQLGVATDSDAPDSVHLTQWPTDDYAGHRDIALEEAMSIVMRAVDLGRTLRSQAGINLRQPIRQVWVALPPGASVPTDVLDILGEELNAKAVVYIEDGSSLIERRVRPLLPKIGKRLGPRTQDVLAAARDNDVEYLPDGRIRLAGVDLAADEVEILATPRPGTAVAHDNGLVVVIDTEISDELRAEGDARELSRAVQDLRKQAGLELDDTVDLWLVAPASVLAPLTAYFARLADDTLAASVLHDQPPQDAERVSQPTSGGEVEIALRRHGPGA